MLMRGSGDIVFCCVWYCIYTRCVPGHNYSVTFERLRRHISTAGDGPHSATPATPMREGWQRVRWSGCNRVGSTAAVPTCSMVHALRPSTRVPASSHCRHPPRRRRHRRYRHLRCAPAPSLPRAPSHWPRPPSRRRASSCASQSTCKRSRGKMWRWGWWWWGATEGGFPGLQGPARAGSRPGARSRRPDAQTARCSDGPGGLKGALRLEQPSGPDGPRATAAERPSGPGHVCEPVGRACACRRRPRSLRNTLPRCR